MNYNVIGILTTVILSLNLQASSEAAKKNYSVTRTKTRDAFSVRIEQTIPATRLRGQITRVITAVQPKSELTTYTGKSTRRPALTRTVYTEEWNLGANPARPEKGDTRTMTTKDNLGAYSTRTEQYVGGLRPWEVVEPTPM